MSIKGNSKFIERHKGRKPTGSVKLVSSDIKEGKVPIRREIFRKIKKMVRKKVKEAELKAKLKKPEAPEAPDPYEAYKRIENLMNNAPAPGAKTKEWNIIRLLCYSYRKEHCEAFFRDPDLY